MKRSLTILVLVTIFSLLSACDGDLLSDFVQEPAPTAAATEIAAPPVMTSSSGADQSQPAEVQPSQTNAAAEPSYTPEPPATAAPTATPPPTATLTPLPTPTATPSPTATRRPPPPEAILGMAIDQHEASTSYHFQIKEQETDAGGAVKVQIFDGDYLAPDALSGLMTVQSGGAVQESQVIMFGEQYYATDPESGGWLYHTIETGAAARPDNAYLRQHPFPPAAYTSLTLVGEEEYDGRPVYHLSGDLPAGALDDYGVQAADNIRAEILITVDDLHLVDLALTYEKREPESGELLAAADKITLSQINQPVAIDAPQVTFRRKEHVAEELGIIYQLPADWTLETDQFPSCPDNMSCPAIHLFLKSPAGVYSEITLTALPPSSVRDLEAVMDNSDYEQEQAGALPARLREGTAGIDGLVYPLPGKGLQLSANWAGSAAYETAVRQILDSLQSTLPPAAEGFKKHYLPGWGSFDMPEDWHFVNPFLSDQILISSKDAAVAQETGPEDAVLQIKNHPVVILEPAIDLLRDQLLPSLEYEWDPVSEPAELRINGLEAATITYFGYDDYLEQMTVIKSKDNTRLVVLLSETGADQWPSYKDTIETIRDSLLLEDSIMGPLVAPTVNPPAGYALFADEEQSYQFAYPQSWQLEEEMMGGVVSDIRLDPPAAPGAEEGFVGAVFIYPPSTAIVGDDTLSGSLTAEGQLDALANWSGTLEIQDALRTSSIQSGNQLDTDYAAASYVATWENDQPIYGFMGAVTDTDSAVKMIGWSEDPQMMEQEWLNIFNSIQILNVRDLDRTSAEPMEPGEPLFGAVSVMDEAEQLYSFNGVAGDSYLLISTMLNTIVADGESMMEGFAIVDVGVYDPQDHILAYQNDVSMIIPAVSRFTIHDPGEHILTVSADLVESAAGYMLRLLPVNEDNPALIAQESGVLDGNCEEFVYTGIGARQVAVHAMPVGAQAGENALSIDILDGAGETITDFSAYKEIAGQPVAFLLAVPEDDAFTVRVCEQSSKAAEFELVIMVSEE